MVKIDGFVRLVLGVALLTQALDAASTCVDVGVAVVSVGCVDVANQEARFLALLCCSPSS